MNERAGPPGAVVRVDEAPGGAGCGLPERAAEEAPVPRPSPRPSVLRALVSLGLAALLWLPSAHLLFRRDPTPLMEPSGVAPFARRLAAWHLHLWTDPASRAREVARMRRSNAEWDFMGRTFLVLALANLALRDPAERGRCLEVIDAILTETLRLEDEHGFPVFLLPYWKRAPYAQQPARSLFVDSEIALMLGARRLVEEHEGYRELLRRRVELVAGRMAAAPVLSSESYPDECWLFDNATALAATRMADALDGTDHEELRRRWVEVARRDLLHPASGLLISSYGYRGDARDGPEGSSIWHAAHMLQLVDPGFARDQYRRARRELGAALLGIGYAREWPRSWRGPSDIDSGMVIPGLDASPASSGLALVGARAFGDEDYLGELLTGLEVAGFPAEEEGRLRYRASNQVGDAVLLYATLLGPLWDEVERRDPRPVPGGTLDAAGPAPPAGAGS